MNSLDGKVVNYWKIGEYFSDVIHLLSEREITFVLYIPVVFVVVHWINVGICPWLANKNIYFCFPHSILPNICTVHVSSLYCPFFNLNYSHQILKAKFPSHVVYMYVCNFFPWYSDTFVYLQNIAESKRCQYNDFWLYGV